MQHRTLRGVCSPWDCSHVQVLQGAVDVALEALRQIGAFEEAVQAQELSSARGDRSGSSDAMTAAQMCAKLRKLIDQVGKHQQLLCWQHRSVTCDIGQTVNNSAKGLQSSMYGL